MPKHAGCQLRTSNFELPTPQRILVIRLDRIGDVVLSTPVLQALREAYPKASIAMMVRPTCRELVEGNPYLDEVILYDKDDRHRSIVKSVRFALGLRRFQFDTALILHPSNRSHWIPWLAGIPVRIGYRRKSGWLLSHPVPHRKQEGIKHEAEYTLDLLRVLPAPASAQGGPAPTSVGHMSGPGGITPPSPRPFVPIHPEADRRVEELLAEQGVGPGDCLVAIHPSASDRSKRWMPERFASVADQLIDTRGANIVLVAGASDVIDAQAVEREMCHRPLNLAGRLSVGELASLLRRCRVLISNDSAPVHIAAAVRTPVVAIFGRTQPGVGARRWGPLGEQHVVLQKDGPCELARPHDCDFELCRLRRLSVAEVYQAATSLLNSPPNVR